MKQKEILSYRLSEICIKFDYMAELVLKCPPVLKPNLPFDAATDGIVMFFSDLYFTRKMETQWLIVLHEVFHVGMSHPKMMYEKSICRPVMNYAMDALINEALINLGIEADEFKSLYITFENLVKSGWIKAEDQETCKKMHVLDLYEYMMQTKGNKLMQEQSELLQQLLEKMDVLEPTQEGQEHLDKQRSRGIFVTDELLEKQWQDAFKRLGKHPGTQSNGALIHLINQIVPKPKFDWRRYLQERLVPELMPDIEPSPTRLHRHVGLYVLQSKHVPYIPGYVQVPGIELIGVCLDTSLSIAANHEKLHQFLAYVDLLQHQTGADVYLICADADVLSEQIVNPHIPISSRVRTEEVKLRGEGGTNFVPALERFEQKHIPIVLYFTDLEGYFGTRTPNIDRLIWLSINRQLKAPFGETVYVE